MIHVEPNRVGLVVFPEEEDFRQLGDACHWHFVFVGVEQGEGYVFLDQKRSNLLVLLVEGLNIGKDTSHASHWMLSAVTSSK